MLARAPELESLHSLRHGFTGRAGGVSNGRLASLNLARRDGETPEALVTNWNRVARELHPDWTSDQVVLLDQIHGGEVVEASTATGPLGTLAAADAVVTTQTQLILAIRTADCVPILFAGPGAVGAAHAGWRGVAAGVVPGTVQRMGQLGVSPGSLVAVVGPHIGVDAYEVGAEVVAGIVDSGVPEFVFVQQRDRPHVDLRAAVVHQLRSCGVGVIMHVRACTFSDRRWFSHRRDGPITGRQAAVIGLCPC